MGDWSWPVGSSSAPTRTVEVAGNVTTIADTASIILSSASTVDALQQILDELKRVNIHFQTITEEKITEEDLL